MLYVLTVWKEGRSSRDWNGGDRIEVGRGSRRGENRGVEGFEAGKFEDVGREGRKDAGRRGELRRERRDRDKERRGRRR